MAPTTTPSALPAIRTHFALSTAMATMGARRFAANTAPTAVPSSPAKRPKIETSPPRTKAAASQRWCRCVTRSVSKGTSTGLRTWRVDTQRFSIWKYPTIFGLDAMSPTPTARPETETTRNNTIKNWTSSCHVKLLYVPMFPPILYAQSSRACRTASTPRGALEALRNLRHAEPHADLQALDRLLHRTGERQAEARATRSLARAASRAEAAPRAPSATALFRASSSGS